MYKNYWGLNSEVSNYISNYSDYNGSITLDSTGDCTWTGSITGTDLNDLAERVLKATNRTIKETETMPTKKYDKLGNGLYARDSHELWLYKITEFPICGQYLYLNVDEWDGDITAILRLITKTYGWLERPKYFKIKDKITKAYKMKQEQKEKDEELKKAKVLKLRTSIHITKVEFNGPATIVFWSDNTKTVVKCGKYETIDHEKGLAMAISKKVLGNQGNYFNEFKRWIGEV